MIYSDTLSWIDRYKQSVVTAESPIELQFQMAFTSWLADPNALQPQVELETRRGKFRADFLFKPYPQKTVIYECDGHDYHDPLRDDFRDAFILASKCADEVVRIPGSTIHSNLDRLIPLLLNSYRPLIKADRVAQLDKTDAELSDRLDRQNDALAASEKAYREERTDGLYGNHDVLWQTDPTYIDSSGTAVYSLFGRGSVRFISHNRNNNLPFGLTYIAFAVMYKDLGIDSLVSKWRGLFGGIRETSIFGFQEYCSQHNKKGQVEFGPLFDALAKRHASTSETSLTQQTS